MRQGYAHTGLHKYKTRLEVSGTYKHTSLLWVVSATSVRSFIVKAIFLCGVFYETFWARN